VITEGLRASLPPEPTVEVRWPRAGIGQVVLGGEHDFSTADELDKTLSQTLGGCSGLIVDLRRTQFIDSSTIRALLSAKARAEASSRHFNIVLATMPIVERALQITGVIPALNGICTLDEALEAEPSA